jgi:hypothetical protein
VVALAATAAARAPGAAATNAPEVTIDIAASCQALKAGALAEAMALELRGAEEAVRAYVARTRPRAAAACIEGAAVVEVTSTDGLALRETVLLDRPGLVRFVAIAIVESLAARAIAPANALPPAAARPPGSPPMPVGTAAPASATAHTTKTTATTTATARARAVPPTSPLAAWLSAGAVARLGGSPSWWSGGGALGGELTWGPRLALHLDLVAITGGLDTEPGRVDVRQLSAALGARVGGWLGRLRVEGGASVHGGAVMWTGRPTMTGVSGASDTTPWLGPAADVALAANLGARLRLRLVVEVGRPLLSADAIGVGDRLAELLPVWASAGLGLVVRLTP